MTNHEDFIIQELYQPTEEEKQALTSTWEGPLAFFINGYGVQPTFFWYIYVIGVIFAIKALYKLLLAIFNNLCYNTIKFYKKKCIF